MRLALLVRWRLERSERMTMVVVPDGIPVGDATWNCFAVSFGEDEALVWDMSESSENHWHVSGGPFGRRRVMSLGQPATVLL